MARFTRLEVINTILEVGLLPLFYSAEVGTAIEIVRACVKGGARVIEFTNRGELAYPVFVDLANYCAREEPSVILGIGSIVDAPTAALYMANGASFIIGPNLNADISKLCNRRKMLYLPGCATETEISTAEELGAEICKLFPGDSAGGPAFLKAVMGPCPWHRLLPTGGVEPTETSLAEWIGAGAAAVGMGSKLITPQAVAAQDFDAITRKVSQCVGWIRQARAARLRSD